VTHVFIVFIYALAGGEYQVANIYPYHDTQAACEGHAATERANGSAAECKDFWIKPSYQNGRFVPQP
jgi:hypothetical protein